MKIKRISKGRGISKSKRIDVQAIIFLLFALLFVAAILHIYNGQLMDGLAASTKETLKEVMHQQKQIFCSTLSARAETLREISKIMSVMSPDDLSEPVAIEGLSKISADKGFREIFIVRADGVGLSTKGYTVDLSGQPYFQKAIRGEDCISEVTQTDFDDTPVILFAVPLTASDGDARVICGAYSAYEFARLITPTFSGLGSVNIMAYNGDTIVSISSDSSGYQFKGGNFFDVFKLGVVQILDGDSIGTIIRNVKEQNTGFAKYTFGDTPRYMYYSPLGVNDWFITSIVKADSIEAHSKQMVANSTLLTVCIIGLFALIVAYILYANARHVKILEKMAYFDELTTAPNFAQFRLVLANIIEAFPTRNLIVIKLDVAKFKSVNEVCGSDAGDRMLKAISDALRAFTAAEYATYARIAADEFIFVDSVDAPPGDRRPETIAQYDARNAQFQEMVADQVGFLNGHRITFRFGRYILEPNETDIEAIWKKVNLVHSIAKTQANSPVCDYRPELRDQFVREIEIENRFETALANDEFKLYVQPKYRIKDRSIVGGEALVRWIGADGKPVSYPNEFIPVFERNGSVRQIDFRMLERTCEMLAHIIDEGIPPVRMSVNFSRVHILTRTFMQELCSVVERYGVPRKFIELEITESTIGEDVDGLTRFIDDVHASGFTLAMDDFGTGYSSLGALKNMEIDGLKLDRSFFSDAKDNKRSMSMVETISDMTKRLSITTVAEGVEFEEQIEMLSDLGYEVVQGYYFAKPMPSAEFVRMLEKQAGMA